MLGIFSINVSLFRVSFILKRHLEGFLIRLGKLPFNHLKGLEIPGTQEVLQAQTFLDSLRVGHPSGEAPALHSRSRIDCNTQNMNGGFLSDVAASLSQGVTGDTCCHLRPYFGTLFDHWLVSF